MKLHKPALPVPAFSAYAGRNLPVAGDGLSQYLSEIRRFPLLSAERELMLARRWADQGDIQAAHELVTSHLRLAAKIAMGYRGYGLPLAEIVSEGNIGLMQAVKRFDPSKGFRLATYAMWWIRAAIQEYVLRSWSLVKMGTTTAQKKLFFGLRKAKGKISAFDDTDLRPDQVRKIAHDLNVSEDDVISMNRRLGGDASLNVPLRRHSGAQEGGAGEWQERLADDRPTQEEAYAEREELDKRKTMLYGAMESLSARERDIFTQRNLRDDPLTLNALSERYGVSRERVRQIEARAFEKVQAAMRARAQECGMMADAGA